MTLFADAHAHFSLMTESHEELCSRAYEQGVRTIVNVCVDKEALQQSFVLQDQHPEISWRHVAATPPHDVHDEDAFFSFVQHNVDKLHAIGECGLEYFHAKESKLQQQKHFMAYLHLAQSAHIPVVVHCRDAFEDCLAIIASFPNLRGMLHCFTGTYADACRLLDLGWYISFSGLITYPQQHDLRSTCAKLPLTSLLIETDAPYLTPVPWRGTRNEPSKLLATANAVASCQQRSVQDVAAATLQNTQQLFKEKRP